MSYIEEIVKNDVSSIHETSWPQEMMPQESNFVKIIINFGNVQENKKSLYISLKFIGDLLF